MEIINCPICDSNNSKFYLSLKDRFNITNQSFSLVKCKCSLIYLNPRPNQKEIIKFYQDTISVTGLNNPLVDYFLNPIFW